MSELNKAFFKKGFYEGLRLKGVGKKSIDAEWSAGRRLFHKVKHNINEVSKLCWDNGVSLAEDARCLYENQRYCRAAALSVLGTEEMAKGFILKYYSIIEFFYEYTYRKLCDHPDKHVNINMLFKVLSEDIVEVQEDISFLIAKPTEINKFKNSSLYVLCDRRKGDLSPVSTPELITQAEAKRHLERVDKLRFWAGGMWEMEKADSLIPIHIKYYAQD